MKLTTLKLEAPPRPVITADSVETTAPTGLPTNAIRTSDIAAMEQFFVGVQTSSGVNVTPEKAKRCSVVLACMRGISEDLCALPIDVMKRGKNGDEPSFDHPAYSVLNVAPNDIMTPLEVREHMVFDLMLHGNFYCLLNEDPTTGDLASVWPLQAQYVTRLSQQLVWEYTDPITATNGIFTNENVWRGTVMAANGLDGTALTLLCREAIGLLLAAEMQAARLFSNGVQTDLALTTDDVMDEDTKHALRAALNARHAGSANAWMPLLLEAGLKASRIGLTAQESQYMEARGYQTGDIARAFRYPDVLLGGNTSGKAATYASAEQFFQSYTKHTLGPWATRIEQTANRDLLSPKERAKYYFRHNFGSLLKGDTAARYASYNTGIAGGFLSPADVRRAEGLPFVEGLDYYTRPLNTTATAGGDAGAIKPTDVSGSAYTKENDNA